MKRKSLALVLALSMVFALAVPALAAPAAPYEHMVDEELGVFEFEAAYRGVFDKDLNTVDLPVEEAYSSDADYIVATVVRVGSKVSAGSCTVTPFIRTSEGYMIPEDAPTKALSLFPGGELKAEELFSAELWGGNVDMVDLSYDGFDSGMAMTLVLGDAQGNKAPQPAPVQVTAYQSTTQVELDGKSVTLQAYALQEGDGMTNYVKLRDVADLLDGSRAQFNVEWANGQIEITNGTGYTSRNGQEHQTPYSGNKMCTPGRYGLALGYGGDDGYDAYYGYDERDVYMPLGFVLYDDAGNGSTYYKLRDLGEILYFYVDWTPERGVIVETNKTPWGDEISY